MNIDITRNDSAELREHVERHHYLHRYPDPRSLPFGYTLTVNGERYAGDGRLFGLMVMKKPQHHKQRKLFGYPGLPTAWQVLDLARVWVHPDLQRHREDGHALAVFSQMVSRLWQPDGPPHERIRRVQRDWLDHHPPRFPARPYHIRLLISYCELAHHDGTGYRASGFVRWGKTSDGTKEVYVRQLPVPRYEWRPSAPVQWPLLENIPILYS